MEPAMGIDHGFGDLVPRGVGPRATVHAGVRAGTGEAVALKAFRAKLPRRTRAEVERELGRLVPLRGRVSVLVADGVEDLGDRAALRMELCTQSLADVVEEEGALPVADVIDLGRTLATALAAAHEVGVVHGGVAPGNVLFRPSGEAVLSDFGVALRLVFPHEGGDGVDSLRRRRWSAVLPTNGLTSTGWVLCCTWRCPGCRRILRGSVSIRTTASFACSGPPCRGRIGVTCPTGSPSWSGRCSRRIRRSGPAACGTWRRGSAGWPRAIGLFRLFGRRARRCSFPRRAPLRAGIPRCR